MGTKLFLNRFTYSLSISLFVWPLAWSSRVERTCLVNNVCCLPYSTVKPIARPGQAIGCYMNIEDCHTTDQEVNFTEAFSQLLVPDIFDKGEKMGTKDVCCLSNIYIWYTKIKFSRRIFRAFLCVSPKCHEKNNKKCQKGVFSAVKWVFWGYFLQLVYS